MRDGHVREHTIIVPGKEVLLKAVREATTPWTEVVFRHHAQICRICSHLHHRRRFYLQATLNCNLQHGLQLPHGKTLCESSENMQHTAPPWYR